GATSVGWRIEPASLGFQWSFVRLSMATASVVLLVALVWAGGNWYFAGPPGSRARIDSVEGQAYLIGPAGERALKAGDEVVAGEFIRTGANARAKVRLFESCQVEMNQRAELAVTATRRDTTIHLDQGSIIVQAARRRTGHLYVSAPDCTVAVTGTVFSVNSGTKGSRVAVIEGEVHVKHAGAESILHSGDVVATTQSVGVVPVREEIAWSSNPNQHPTPQELIDQIQVISQYLGDEVVITARASSTSNEHGLVLLAEVRQSGLKDYLQNHLADILKSPQGTANLHVVDAQSLSSLAGNERGMIMLVRSNMLVAGGHADSVRQMSAQLD